MKAKALFVLTLLGLSLCWMITGCGGGNSSPQLPPPLSISVSPSAATMDQGGTKNFTATIGGTNNTAVTWSVQEGVAAGTITSAGGYTAPNASGTFHVIATSVADSSISGSATVTVPQVAVQVSPTAATIFAGDTSPFTGTVTGTINAAVTWTVQEGAAGGSITSAGVYTAPQTIGTFHVIATSQADSTKSATATITVPPVSVAIFPASDTLGPKGLRTFVAIVGGTNNTAVTWSVLEGAAGGAIDANGSYVAPNSQGTFHVVATSVADPSMSASAIVAVVQSGFLPTGSMAIPRASHTATLLNTGKVLVAGGTTESGCNDPEICGPSKTTTTTELFDPATGTFASTASMSGSRASHTATLLQDGRVLVAGGFTGDEFTVPEGNRSAELYDPSTATFTAMGSMTAARFDHTATLLPSAKVLVTGGGIGRPGLSQSLASAELFDPGTGSFTSTGSMAIERERHTATLLQNGKVLVAGGIDSSGKAVFTAELYDPASGTFTSTGSMTTARVGHSATLLPNGTVLIAGGGAGGSSGTSAEIYNPVTGTFTLTGSMAAAHGAPATLLQSGKVLIAGDDTFVAERFDPGTGTFSLTGSMEMPRGGFTATLLPNGDVLVTGGIGTEFPGGNVGELGSAEIYQ